MYNQPKLSPMELTTMTSQVSKYRPSFSAEELFELHSYLINIPDQFKSNASIHGKLLTKIATLTFKVNNGIAPASYVAVNGARESLLDSLGGTQETPIDPNASKLACYNKYVEHINECTEDEILTAIEYKELVVKEKLTPTEQDIINSSWDM